MEVNVIFTRLVILGMCVMAVQAAKWVDAQNRAQNVMNARRKSAMNHQKLEKLDIKHLLGLTEDESIKTVREMPDVFGSRVQKLKVTYKGIEVYDSVITVKKNKKGRLTGQATGKLIQDIRKDLPRVTPTLTDEDTVTIAAQSGMDDRHSLTDVEWRRRIYIDNQYNARLVNIVSYLIDGVKRPFVIVDLNDGTILKKWDGLTTNTCSDKGTYNGFGGNEKIGKIVYGEFPHCLSPTMNNGTCSLENKYVKVVNMKNRYNVYATEAASFECVNGYNDPVNGAFSPALDAFYYGTAVGKMFEEWFGSTALDDKIILAVHYGIKKENAYWDGKYSKFGDGDQYFYPLVSLDVVGHEVGHGVTEQGSDLEYTNESGGVNEAFSDILGEATEYYLRGKSDYVTGYDIIKNKPYLRDFMLPKKDGMSIDHVDHMHADLDPHYSSGVYRKVWWLVVYGYDISIQNTTTVFLYANRLYWQSTSSFYDTSCGLLYAAIDLGIDTHPFRMAFCFVGIDKCDVKAHVSILNNKEPLDDVTVSDTSKPIFKFETPASAGTLLVSANSNEGADVMLTIRKDGWDKSTHSCSDTDTGTFVAEGVSSVTVDNAGNTTFFITMSTNGAPGEGKLHVQITASYT